MRNFKEAQLPCQFKTMQTAWFFVAFVALASAAFVPSPTHNYKTKSVDADFILHQKKVLYLLENILQLNPEEEYYKTGYEYDIKQNFKNYSDKHAVEHFLKLYKHGFLPKHYVFSIFNERMKEEAIALFKLFYFSKDFETFYKTAAFARVHLNEAQFVYALYVAVNWVDFLDGIILPAPYEVMPLMFTNSDVWQKIHYVKMEKSLMFPEIAKNYGIVHKGDKYVFYSNYSNYILPYSEEQKIDYLTEDIGWNSMYFYWQTLFPDWMDVDQVVSKIHERRGEAFFYFYQQLLSRYYMERLVNGLGEIPSFSWYTPIKTGYTPLMYYKYPFLHRNDYYQIPIDKHYEEVQFLDSYENMFMQYMQTQHFKVFNQEVDFHNSKAINFVGNYWDGNFGLYSKLGYKYNQRSYEDTARLVLSGAPEYYDNKYTVFPSALQFYSTSLRDPMFYQLYSKIAKYIIQYKEHLEPYSREYLSYPGVKVNDVKISDLVTFFDFYDFDVTNGVVFDKEELKTETYSKYNVRQMRLNHKPFDVTLNVKSEIEGEAIVKFFMAPKYDSNGFIDLKNNWMNFFELDQFVYNMTKGQMEIVRHSGDFYSFKEDSAHYHELFKFMEGGKIPFDMSENYDDLPNRLMLPKGTKDGYPFQFFVMIYKREFSNQNFAFYNFDDKPFGYPFDRPAHDYYFTEPNMYFKDIFVHHEGFEYPYVSDYSEHFVHHNEVPKH